MARNQGILPFSGNFELQAAGPIDARTRVDLVTDLTGVDTWRALDGNIYTYVGMYTFVTGDTEKNNGLYYLRALPATEGVNWAKVVASGESGAGVDYITQVSNKPQINGVTLDGDVSLTELGVINFRAVPVASLDDVTDPVADTVIYLVPNDVNPDVRDEWMWAETPIGSGTYDWDKIGIGIVDLTDYYTKAEIDAMVTVANTGLTSVKTGGVEVGTDIAGLSFNELVDLTYFPLVEPTLEEPTSTFEGDVPSLVALGTVLDVNFTTTLDRGLIDPAFTTTGFRSGPANTYVYTGTGLPANVASAEGTNDQTASVTFSTLGPVSWTAQVSFDAGEQPVDSKGDNYSTPLEAGNTTATTVTTEVVLPTYATSNTIGEMTAATVLYPVAADYFDARVVAESDSEKQAVAFPQSMGTLTGVQFLNTISGNWEFLGGSAAASLLQFETPVASTFNIGGTDHNYWTVAHKATQAKIGARDLRFFV